MLFIFIKSWYIKSIYNFCAVLYRNRIFIVPCYKRLSVIEPIINKILNKMKMDKTCQVNMKKEVASNLII